MPVRRVSWTTVLIVLVLVLAWTLLGVRSFENARRQDYLNLYTGASLARDGQYGSLFLPGVQRQREQELAGVVRLVEFNRPHFYAALLSPLSWLEFRKAQVVWLLVHLAVLTCCGWWAWRRFGPDALVILALFFPLGAGIPHGQDAVFVLALLIASYVCAGQGRHWAAGMLLGATLFKFHLLMMFPLVLLLQRRWRMLAGMAAVGLMELAICLWLAGIAGLRQYAVFLSGRSRPEGAVSPEMMPNVYSLAANLGVLSTSLSVLLAAIVVIGVGYAAWRSRAWWQIYGLAIAGGILVAPHVYPYDGAALLLPVWSSYFQGRTRWLRATAVLLACPVPWIMCLAPPPYALVSGLSVLLFTGALAVESIRTISEADASTVAENYAATNLPLSPHPAAAVR